MVTSTLALKSLNTKTTMCCRGAQPPSYLMRSWDTLTQREALAKPSSSPMPTLHGIPMLLNLISKTSTLWLMLVSIITNWNDTPLPGIILSLPVMTHPS